jgi:hypothetical protein
VGGRAGDGAWRRARRPAGGDLGRGQRARAARGGAGAHGPVRVRQDHASRHARRFVFCFRLFVSDYSRLHTTRAACVRFTDAEYSRIYAN